MTKEVLDYYKKIFFDDCEPLAAGEVQVLFEEIDRLQAELDTVNNDIFMSEKNLQVAFEAAYKRGAEAMRSEIVSTLMGVDASEEDAFAYGLYLAGNIPAPEYKNGTL